MPVKGDKTFIVCPESLYKDDPSNLFADKYGVYGMMSYKNNTNPPTGCIPDGTRGPGWNYPAIKNPSRQLMSLDSYSASNQRPAPVVNLGASYAADGKATWKFKSIRLE